MGTVDGPGLRYVIFMQGCRYRCVFCHNPDTFDMKGGKYLLSAEEVFKRISELKCFYKQGGVTVSGGEPLLQVQFLIELFKMCKDAGIHTAIDTAGVKVTSDVEKLLTYTNLVLLDIKSIRGDMYKKITGQEIDYTLEFAEYLSKINKSIWLRHVLVPGYTDDDQDLERLAEYAQHLHNVERVEVLPFHKMGEAKYQNLGLAYQLYDVEEPSAERIENAKAIFRRNGLYTV